MRHILVTSIAYLLAIPPAFAAEPGFDAFRCWLSGSWDNAKQAEADIRNGATGSALHPRRAMTYVPIVNPAIEGQLFAILNFGELGFDGPLTRVALHRFRPAKDAIVHEFMFLIDKARWGDLGTDLAPLRRLVEDDVRVNSDCAMRWHWAGDHFEGSTAEGRCITSSFTPEPIRVEGHGELWRDKLVRHDRNYSLAGEALPVPGGETPEVFLKLNSGPGDPTCSNID